MTDNIRIAFGLAIFLTVTSMPISVFAATATPSPLTRAILSMPATKSSDTPYPYANDKDVLNERKAAELAEIHLVRINDDSAAQELLLRENAFWQQGIASWIILVMVLVIVSAGLWFSWMQFLVSIETHRTQRGSATALAAAGADVSKVTAQKGEAIPGTTSANLQDIDKLATTLNISLQGIQLSSSVLGTVVMVISLAFFYLYLQTVYPISEVVKATTVSVPVPAATTSPKANNQ